MFKILVSLIIVSNIAMAVTNRRDNIIVTFFVTSRAKAPEIAVATL